LNWLRFGAFLMTAHHGTHPASSWRVGFGTALPPSIQGQPLPPSDPAGSARSSYRIERSRCVDQPSRRAPLFPFGGARASIRQRIVKERLRFPSSMILRWDRPPLESWSGMLSFLDDTRSLATGLFFPNQPEEGIPSRPFPRCPMRLLFDPQRTRPLQKCYAGDESGAGTAGRAGEELPGALVGGCSPLWNFPPAIPGGAGAGPVEGIALAVNGVRVTLTLTPTASSRAERSPDPIESRSSGPRAKQERCVWCLRNSH